MKKKSNLAMFISYYKPHLGLFMLDMICAIGVAAVDLAFPLATKYALQNLLPEKLYAAFFGLVAGLFVFYLLRSGMQYIITYWGHTMGARLEADVREDLFYQLQRLSFHFFDTNRTGQLMSRVTGDLFETAELAHHGPEDLLISVLTLVGAFIVMLTIEWTLAVVVFAAVPILIIITTLLRRNMMKAADNVQVKLASINGAVEAAISGMRTAKAFANEDAEAEKFKSSNALFRTAKKQRYKAMAAFMCSSEFFISIMSVLVIAFGGYLIMKGKLDYIELITFNLYIATFISPVKQLSRFVEQYLVGMAGFNRFAEIMRLEPEIVDKENAPDIKDVKGDIVFENVSFSYDGDVTVLEGIDLHIRPGETVAAVGSSGGGKTTLCSLIPRFYDVSAGSIKVDGNDVRDITQRSLRKNIGIVQQDVHLFAGTILENILYGRRDATLEEVREAARRAEILEDIEAMPNGFDTYVGERGVMLSGGQKQRISIARIFLKNPAILILDEATSALDSVTEYAIQRSFDELAKGRTSLIIAHRLSTVRDADRIVVIEDGKIAEEGSHDELLKLGGRYAELYNAQKLHA